MASASGRKPLTTTREGGNATSSPSETSTMLRTPSMSPHFGRSWPTCTRREPTRDDAKLPKAHLDLSSVKALSPAAASARPFNAWGRRDWALLALLYCSGMRVGEVCALDRGQLPLDARAGSRCSSCLSWARDASHGWCTWTAWRRNSSVSTSATARTICPRSSRPYKGPDGGAGSPPAQSRALRRYSRAAGLLASPTRPHATSHLRRPQAAGRRGHAHRAGVPRAPKSRHHQRHTRITDAYLRESWRRAHAYARPSINPPQPPDYPIDVPVLR